MSIIKIVWESSKEKPRKAWNWGKRLCKILHFDTHALSFVSECPESHHDRVESDDGSKIIITNTVKSKLVLCLRSRITTLTIGLWSQNLHNDLNILLV